MHMPVSLGMPHLSASIAHFIVFDMAGVPGADAGVRLNPLKMKSCFYIFPAT
jgi:hypothetical protein